MPCVGQLKDQQHLYEKTHASHAAILFDAGFQPVSMAEDVGRHNALDKAIGEIFALAVANNGTLSGEHGIGIAKREYLDLVIDEPTRAFMRRVKETLDPQGQAERKKAGRPLRSA